jgi:DNA invertase Pin-like site-specific DNA recombinase
MPRQSKVEAVAYLRTSSAANVGAEKDSEHRQREAVLAFARRAGMTVVDESSYDAAVGGEDDLADRPGFSALLDRIEGNGVCAVTIEDASRFAARCSPRS